MKWWKSVWVPSVFLPIALIWVSWLPTDLLLAGFPAFQCWTWVLSREFVNFSSNSAALSPCHYNQVMVAADVHSRKFSGLGSGDTAVREYSQSGCVWCHRFFWGYFGKDNNPTNHSSCQQCSTHERPGRWLRICRDKSKPLKTNATGGCLEYRIESIQRTNSYVWQHGNIIAGHQ